MSDVVTDVLIILGAAIVAVALGWIAVPLGVAWLGLMCLAAGVSRLPRRKDGAD